MRILLWESMLRADMNLRYWDEMMRRQMLREQRLRVAQLLLSSGTVATWLLWLQAEWAWRISSVLAAGLSVYLYHSGSRKLVEKVAGLRRTYATCLVQYENLWSRLQDGGASDELRPALETLRAKEYDETSDEPYFLVDVRLLTKCKGDVLRTRNLDRE